MIGRFLILRAMRLFPPALVLVLVLVAVRLAPIRDGASLLAFVGAHWGTLALAVLALIYRRRWRIAAADNRRWRILYADQFIVADGARRQAEIKAHWAERRARAPRRKAPQP